MAENEATAGPRPNRNRRRPRRPRHTEATQVVETIAPVDEQSDLSLSASIQRQLTDESYECIICYEAVKRKAAVWDCAVCYKVFHMKCLKTWITKSSTNDHVWRCPGCQTESQEKPMDYYCFCKKTIDPRASSMIIPHSCGQPCGRLRDCPHRCTNPCHPGPCEPCLAYAPPIPCYCGKKKFVTTCQARSALDRSCHQICLKTLSCGRHLCTFECHQGECEECDKTLTLTCRCVKETKAVACKDWASPELNYDCDQVCGFMFECGEHICPLSCHAVSVHDTKCSFDPSMLIRCNCGKTTIKELNGGHDRQHCTDPIPSCDLLCYKQLPCGHQCLGVCHSGDCPPCPEQVTVKCRCKSGSFKMICHDLIYGSGGRIMNTPMCSRPCKKLKMCNRHRCQDTCCDMDYHICEDFCGKTLTCRSHRCSYPCGHAGRCHECFEGVSFEERSCHCGGTKMYPPIPCGTKPPICHLRCVRRRPCGHPNSNHECHTDDVSCPPCMTWASRPCACGKTTFNNIPCSRTTVPMCTLRCNLPLPSCSHTCQRMCHSGDCLVNDAKCTQTCGAVRSLCGHVCGYLCHTASGCNEDRPCAAKLSIQCPCERFSKNVPCGKFRLSDGTPSDASRQSTLECDDECKRLQRNKKLAEALQITDASVFSPKPRHNYSEKMISVAKSNLKWIRNVDKTATSFVESILNNNVDRLSAAGRATFHFPCFKSAQNKCLVLYLINAYELEAEVVDEERGKGNVIMREPLNGTPKIPDPLLSVVAEDESAVMFHDEAAFDKLAEQHGLSVKQGYVVNTVMIRGLILDIETEDLRVLIEGLVGREQYFVCLKMLETEQGSETVKKNCALMLQPKLDPSFDEEKVIVDLAALIHEKFVVMNVWAEEVTTCMTTMTSEIVMKPEQAPLSPEEQEAAFWMDVQAGRPVTRKVIETKNAFESLSLDKH